MKRTSFSYLLSGLMFSILFASASIAGKVGLQSMEGVTFYTVRLISAGLILLGYAHVIKRYRIPSGLEWVNVFVFGAFGCALYLGLFIVALQSVAAGITALGVALNPLIISVLTSVWMKRKVSANEWIGIVLGIIGVTIATYPLLNTGHASLQGLIILALSVLSYSVGSVYYSSVTWTLPRITINAWQTIIGGVLLLPFAALLYNGSQDLSVRFWFALAWITIPVSIFASQLWLRLLRDDAVRASLWLFLCPVFGLGLATLLLDEPFVYQTAIGSAIVLLALYLGQRGK